MTAPTNITGKLFGLLQAVVTVLISAVTLMVNDMRSDIRLLNERVPVQAEQITTLRRDVDRLQFQGFGHGQSYFLKPKDITLSDITKKDDQQ